MPTFCRHNRLVQNCPICSREQAVQMRPVVSSGGVRTTPAGTGSPPAPASRSRAKSTGGGRSTAGLRVSRLARGIDDGYRCALAPGLRSSADAQRLAQELAFATGRLTRLANDPPGLYAVLAAGEDDVEERIWLAFLIAYLCPLDTEEPFAAIADAAASWSSDEPPALDAVRTGPRSAHDPSRGLATVAAYRAWAQRAGSQAAAFIGEPAWTPERRFARVFERLALPGFHRDARFDLLVSLGWTGVYELRAGSLQLGGENAVTVAAKRALGIGDSLLLERRAAELARACELPLEALDLGLYNWERDERASLGLGREDAVDPQALARARAALGL
ncbi:MAG: hypothetical protein ACR2QA_16505 [Solirubrobacteraceae bacterium]